MPYLRQNKELIFTSGSEVLAHYTRLISQLSARQLVTAQGDDRATEAQLDDLRRELVNQLKNFSHSQVDMYFNEAMDSAETDQERYALSNAYEELLLAELGRIKEKLYILRTT